MRLFVDFLQTKLSADSHHRREALTNLYEQIVDNMLPDHLKYFLWASAECKPIPRGQEACSWLLEKDCFAQSMDKTSFTEYQDSINEKVMFEQNQLPQLRMLKNDFQTVQKDFEK